MNKFIIFHLLLWFGVTIGYAQNILGSKITAMGNNGAAIKDIWSISANTAGITATQSPCLALNYTKQLVDKELSRQAIALIIPLQRNFFGFGFQRYGITTYNEIKAGLAMAKKFGDQLSIGLKINYHQLKITNYGKATGFSVDVGAMYQLTKQLTLGVYFNNPAQQQYNNASVQIDIPSIFYLGAAYVVTDKVLLAGSINKILTGKIEVGFGIDYQIVPILSLRGGLSTKPFKQYTGFGLNFKKLSVDAAVESDPNLGYSPQISLAYAF